MPRLQGSSAHVASPISALARNMNEGQIIQDALELEQTLKTAGWKVVEKLLVALREDYELAGGSQPDKAQFWLGRMLALSDLTKAIEQAIAEKEQILMRQSEETAQKPVSRRPSRRGRIEPHDI